MKTKIFYAATAIVASLAVASCSSSDEPNAQEKPVYITVNTQIGNATSRTTTQEDGTEVFSNGDVISVYAWTGSASVVPTELVVNNSLNTLTGGTWVANPQMLWQNTAGSVSINDWLEGETINGGEAI